MRLSVIGRSNPREITWLDMDNHRKKRAETYRILLNIWNVNSVIRKQGEYFQSGIRHG